MTKGKFIKGKFGSVDHFLCGSPDGILPDIVQ